MKAKELKELIDKHFKDDEDVLLTNAMGYPAYDYDGMRFELGFNPESRTLTIYRENTNWVWDWKRDMWVEVKK